MVLYDLLRKANGARKAWKKRRMGRFMSPVRRIERVAPIEGLRVCAMTFDDGPFNLPPSPDAAGGRALTEFLCGTLGEYGACATFDIVGDTSENYPDACGQEGAFSWGGKRFDHYPDFGRDAQGGAVNCPDLVDMLVRSGMELSNHGYRHLLFGPKRAVYGARACFKSIDEVLADLNRLHEHVAKKHFVRMALARPPHYVDNIPGGFSAYDAYELMGYNYMAASFDAGGWLPDKAGYESEVRGMTQALARALDADPDCLNGQIIFQKDGCNMARRTPVAGALAAQLKLLRDHGYAVVPVSRLLEISPFEDLSPRDGCFQAVRFLLGCGMTLGFRDNTFRPERPLAFGELCVMLCPRSVREDGLRARILSGARPAHPYAAAISWAREGGLIARPDAVVDARVMEKALSLVCKNPDVRHDGTYSRAQAAVEIARNLL